MVRLDVNMLMEVFVINGLFKKANLNAAFSISSEIIQIISSQNKNDKLDDFLSLDAIAHDEFLVNLLNKNIDKIISPQKETLLHVFIREFYEMYIYNEFYYYEDSIFDSGEFEGLYNLLEQFGTVLKDFGLDTTDLEENINRLIEKFDLEYEKESPNTKPLESEVQQLIDDMRNTTLSLRDELTENVFFLLFSNKKFLFDFNMMIAEYITPENLPREIFDRFCHIKRCSYIPKWLENGIIYRDRATCQQCGADLSNSYRIMENGQLHFDHIIPLEKSGTNDATNFQLLCANCNLTKNDTLQLPNYQYQMYWK